MMNKWICAVFVFALSPVALATFIPKDQLRPDWMLSVGSPMTEAEFNETVNSVARVYAPIVASFGARLDMRPDWSDTTPNAYADQRGSTWSVAVLGGLGRRPEITTDGLLLVACHELGHHLGGFPFHPGSFFQKTWAANEGQSDFFASHVCARKMWESETERNAGFAETVDPHAKTQCDQVWTSLEEQHLCYRIAAAGLSISRTLAGLSNKTMPSMETPDTRVVSKTSNGHPEPQCRLDTSMSAALCKAAFDDRLIPGKTASAGANSEAAEREAALQSCTNHNNFAVGLRPGCWFKSRL